jgi:glycosyltransferase involved in cell wall biosynthesis
LTINPRRNFVIACEVVDNVLLMKPHGMVPFTMMKAFGYEAEVVTYQHGEYPYAERELKGLKLHFLHPLLYKKAKWPFFWYLAKNAKNIDVLMVYNIKKRPIYNGLIYKLFNPNGFLYAKADTSNPNFGFYVDNAFFLYRWWMRSLGKLFLHQCNAISVESSEVFNKVTQIPKEKLMLIPCGFDPDIVQELGVKERSFSEKDNLVLHVARMGIPQKNSELLLNAIINMDIPDNWKFIFIGSQTALFKKRVHEFRKKYPDKSKRVDFIEHIRDKSLLYDYYSRARIFCLPSKRETFGNVLVEAQYFGNAIAGSEHLPSVKDLIDEGRAGITFDADNSNDLASKLRALMCDHEKLRAMSEASRLYANEKLLWRTALYPLQKAIEAHYEKVGA